MKFDKKLLLLTALFIPVLFFLDIALGSVSIPFSEVFSTLFGIEDNNIWQNIIVKSRLPRAMTAIFCGIGLSLAGLQMQTLFRNPLAGPSILGITAGASLGVAVLMLGTGAGLSFFTLNSLKFLGAWTLVFFAFVGSFLIILLLVLISTTRRNNNVSLLIVGMMFSNFSIAIVSIWQYFSKPEQIQDYLLWTFGSLSGVMNEKLWVLGITTFSGIIFSFLLIKPLNILILGENYAKTLGVSVYNIRLKIILVTSLLTASITAFCGPIAFIGIAVPHFAKILLKTTEHKYLFWASLIFGSILMLCCDIIAKMPQNSITLPINIITSLIGSPIIIWIAIKNKF